jgi:Sulfotransferase domain
MMIRLAYLANYFLERDITGRALFRLPDDVFVVAYPGSGGQWLRCLIANLLDPPGDNSSSDPSSPVTEANVMSRLPDLYHASRRGFAKMKRPRIIFSHECFDPEYRKVIYLVRDPRDVAVVQYEQRRQGGSIDNAVSIEQFVSTFLMRTDEYESGWAEEFSGAIKANHGFAYRSRLKDEFLGTPASWGENVMSWIGARGRDPNAMLLLRYEDLLSDPQAELGKIAAFLKLAGLNIDGLNVNASPERIRTALTAAQSQTNPQDPGKWSTALPKASVQAIESTWGPVMTAIGYAPQARELQYR